MFINRFGASIVWLINKYEQKILFLILFTPLNPIHSRLNYGYNTDSDIFGYTHAVGTRYYVYTYIVRNTF